MTMTTGVSPPSPSAGRFQSRTPTSPGESTPRAIALDSGREQPTCNSSRPHEMCLIVRDMCLPCARSASVVVVVDVVNDDDGGDDDLSPPRRTPAVCVCPTTLLCRLFNSRAAAATAARFIICVPSSWGCCWWKTVSHSLALTDSFHGYFPS